MAYQSMKTKFKLTIRTFVLNILMNPDMVVNLMFLIQTFMIASDVVFLYLAFYNFIVVFNVFSNNVKVLPLVQRR